MVLLDCGHEQVVSSYRVRVASEGHEQHAVFCVTCSEWARLAPSEPQIQTQDNRRDDGERERS